MLLRENACISGNQEKKNLDLGDTEDKVANLETESVWSGCRGDQNNSIDRLE